jgi:hypothetical protein
VGRLPFSLSSLAFTSTITRISVSRRSLADLAPLFELSHSWCSGKFKAASGLYRSPVMRWEAPALAEAV